MAKAKVYDHPTRLFHWLFAGLFVVIFAIAKLTDDESSWFSQHMLLGLILVCVTLLRLVWGLVGSRYAKFSSFPLNLAQLTKYFREFSTAKATRYFGHNPASAWASLIMIGLALALGVTGYLMATGHKESFEDIHELLAYGFAIVAVLHVAGVILHSLKHRDEIALSMINGEKDNPEGALPLSDSKGFVALAMAGIVAFFAFQVYKNYDADQSTTHLFGVKLQLGEHGEHEHEKESHEDEGHDG